MAEDTIVISIQPSEPEQVVQLLPAEELSQLGIVDEEECFTAIAITQPESSVCCNTSGSLPPDFALIIHDVPCEASVYVGSAVFMQSNGIAKNALANDWNTSNVLGFVESKANSLTCTIKVIGLTTDLFGSLDVTQEYYLSDSVAGGISTSAPTTSGHIKLKLGQPFSVSRLVIMKGERLIRL